MLTAAPDTIWLPRASIDAKPWARAKASEAAVPAASPTQALPLASAVAADAKAAASIFPSRPMSKMPARSDQSPARQAKISGTEPAEGSRPGSSAEGG